MTEQKGQIFNLAFLYEFTEGDKTLMLHFIKKKFGQASTTPSNLIHP